MALIRRSEANEGGMLARRAWDRDPFDTMRELANWDPFPDIAARLGVFAGPRLAVPAFDVKETKDAYVFTADLPGYRDEDVEVNLTGNRLSVSGHRDAERVEDSDTYYCAERSYGSFTRTFTVPEGVETDKVDAELSDGVLTMRIPKSPEAKPKRISLRRMLSGTKKEGPSS